MQKSKYLDLLHRANGLEGKEDQSVLFLILAEIRKLNDNFTKMFDTNEIEIIEEGDDGNDTKDS